MKKQFLKIKARQVTYLMFLLSALAIFSISCEKEDSVAPVATENPELSIVEVLQSFGETETEEGANLKRGRGAPAPGDASIAEIAIDAEFNELVGALSYVDEELDAGLVDLFLKGTDQYTVFAPTDDAFMKLYDALGDDVDEIRDLPAQLVLDVLFYHVTEGRRASNSVLPPRGYRTITTLLEETFKVDPDGKIEAIGNEANITAADVSASNGIIHVIDAVILPIHGEESSKAALKKGHEGNGKSLPPGDESIATIATNAGFTELVEALIYVDGELNTGLVDLFSDGTDQYTVFAPTNKAFEALYDLFNVGDITEIPAETVRDVLLYHVTEGRRASNSVVPPVRPREITTLLGETFSVNSEGVIDAIGNEANIVKADISASNGIIHVIDAVLLPLE